MPKIQRGGIDIYENGDDPVPQQGMRGSDKGIGCSDYFSLHTEYAYGSQ